MLLNFSLILNYGWIKKKASLFWLSGSQQFPLMKNLSESLSGRVAILKLLGLSSSEIHKTKKYFLKRLGRPFILIKSHLLTSFVDIIHWSDIY